MTSKDYRVKMGILDQDCSQISTVFQSIAMQY